MMLMNDGDEVNIRQMIGEDIIANMFSGRYIDPKRLLNIPDGVYDVQAELRRVVVIDGFILYLINREWIKEGGPPNLPSYIACSPWGYFPDIENEDV